MTAVDQRWLTWPEAGRLGADAVGLIGVGATEQHGPHLPLATDSATTEVLLARCADLVDASVVVAPVIPVGLSEHHVAFPGTISIATETLGALLDAYVEAFSRMGITRIGVISGHGGNFGFLGEYARDGAGRFRSPRVVAFDRLAELLETSFDTLRALGLEPVATDGHAGLIETSIGLHMYPERVRDFAGVDGYTAAEPGWLERLFHGGVHALSSTGVIGDPAGSTGAAGAALLDALAAMFARWLAGELDLPLRAEADAAAFGARVS